jgi:hypothetical protein
MTGGTDMQRPAAGMNFWQMWHNGGKRKSRTAWKNCFNTIFFHRTSEVKRKEYITAVIYSFLIEVMTVLA